MLRLFYLQDYLYSPITQLFLKYFNDLCHKTYFNRNFGAVALCWDCVSKSPPLMCSEFWPGWFDHWGCPHETWSTKALVEGMKAMLDRNISFSLYMAHRL